MLIQTLRLKRGWSQQQLAEFSGLSVRTIQRIEAGSTANAETLKSIASVFDIDFSTLSSEQEMTTMPQQRIEEEEAFQHVRRLKRFYLHLMQYIAVVSVIAVINYFVSSHYMWVVWMAIGWGSGVLIHGLTVFQPTAIFGPAWERQQVEKRLGRSL